MATRKAGQVTLRGRFTPGSRVRLVKVAGPEVLTPSASDEVVESKTVGEDGCVRFSKGVEVDGRYFISGYVNGTPLNVRVRGNTAEYEDSLPVQDPVQPDPVRHRDGTLAGVRGVPVFPLLEEDGTAEAPLPAQTLKPVKTSAEEVKEKVTDAKDGDGGDEGETARRRRAAQKGARTRARRVKAEEATPASKPADATVKPAASSSSAKSSGSGAKK